MRVGSKHFLVLKISTRLNKPLNTKRQGDFKLVVIVKHIDKRANHHTYKHKYEIEIEVDGEQWQNACFGNKAANIFQVDHGRDENARRVALLLACLHWQRVRERRHNVEDEIGQDDLVEIEDDLALHDETHAYVRARLV